MPQPMLQFSDHISIRLLFADVKTTLNCCYCCCMKGVVHGVTGIVTQPVEGAKQEGVSGFFKGSVHC